MPPPKVLDTPLPSYFKLVEGYHLSDEAVGAGSTSFCAIDSASVIKSCLSENDPAGLGPFIRNE